MIRYHLGLDGQRVRAASGCGRCSGLLAYASITGDHAPALPGAAAVELGHNFSLVHDDIEDGDVERRHRATLWAIHGVPQAINTGDMLFTPVAGGAPPADATSASATPRSCALMRLYDETCLALCEGQYIDIWDVRAATSRCRSSCTST